MRRTIVVIAVLVVLSGCRTGWRFEVDHPSVIEFRQPMLVQPGQSVATVQQVAPLCAPPPAATYALPPAAPLPFAAPTVPLNPCNNAYYAPPPFMPRIPSSPAAQSATKKDSGDSKVP